MAETRTTLRSVPEPDAPQGDIEVWAARWRRELRADGKQARTITDYGRTLDYFDAWLAEEGRSRFVGDLTRADVEDFRDHYLDGTKPDGTPYSRASAKAYTACLRSFFRWLADDLPDPDGIPTNIAEKVKLPIVKPQVQDVPTDEDVERVFKTTKGTTFEDLRDRAILGFLITTGTRLSGVAGIKLEDVDLDAHNPHCKITLKGGAEHRAYLNRKGPLPRDFDRYLARRAKHPHASSPYLWIGRRGKMGTSGIYQMVQRRAESVGVKITVHDFRRYAASTMLNRGARPDDVQNLLGWQDRSMLNHYVAATASDRAAEALTQFDPSMRE